MLASKEIRISVKKSSNTEVEALLNDRSPASLHFGGALIKDFAHSLISPTVKINASNRFKRTSDMTARDLSAGKKNKMPIYAFPFTNL